MNRMNYKSAFKLTILGLSFLLMSSAFAMPDFQCITGVPTTSAIVQKDGDKVWFEFIHHNGVNFAPIHAGIITGYDLPFISEKGQLLAKMGNSIRVPFELLNCKVHEEGNYHCFNNKPLTIGTLDVSSYGFFTHQTKSFLLGTTFSEFNFKFYVRTTKGESLESEMNYDLNSRDCDFERF